MSDPAEQALRAALTEYAAGDWQATSPIHRRHAAHCAAMSEGQHCCLQPNHDLFTDMCRFLVARTTPGELIDEVWSLFREWEDLEHWGHQEAGLADDYDPMIAKIDQRRERLTAFLGPDRTPAPS